MPQPPLLQTKNTWWVGALALIFALGFAPRLPGATVITGDVTPALPWSSSTQATIGNTGAGTLAIDGGSQLSSLFGHLGVSPGSTGTATISGAGSKWTNSFELHVGFSGSGALSVEAGGRVSSGSGYLGYWIDSTGMATITGPSSTWTYGSFYVGRSGSGSLRVEAGGQLSGTHGYIADAPGSTGTATITGAGSSWTNSGSFHVGRSGSGVLTVENGGRVTAKTLHTSLSDLRGNGTIAATGGAVLDADLHFNAAQPAQAVFGFGTGGTLTVTPTASGGLGAGYKGLGSLTIAEGVAVSSSFGSLGYNAGSTGTATISGAGSKWTNSAQLFVGRVGGGSLRVEAGGQVSNDDGYVGDFAGSTGTATITGAGSKWTNSAALYVGDSGNGTLHVEAGGQVSNTSGYLGYNSGSTGTATISGTGSKWTNSSALYVGRKGSGSLTVEDGGHVSTGTLHASLVDLHGNGTITATTGAVLDADLQFNAAHPAQAVFGFGAGGTLTVTAAGGVLGAGYKGLGSLTVSQGVAVSSSAGYLGNYSGSTGTAMITGAGSKWINSSEFYLGYSGSGALRVEAGGQVSNTSGYLGVEVGSTGTATITGPGSKWTNSSALSVGRFGSGALRVEAGGQVNNTLGYLGYNAGSTGTVTIAGAGSTWTNSSSLYVGYNGSGALRVEAGGQVSNADPGYLGGATGSMGTATITGVGSTWTNRYTLYVGQSGSGSLRVEAGGQVSNTGGGYLGSGAGSTGTATVTGVGSTWTGNSPLYIGYIGSGSLWVEAGGQVSSGAGYLGYNAGSTGTAMIMGTGSTWTNNATLYVGHSGSGALRVEAGGQLSDINGYLGFSTGSTGAATITGAGSKWINSSTLYVGDAGSGALTITAGGLVSVRQTLRIDSNGNGDGFVNLATGGMLALWGDADDSLAQFLGLVAGTDAIRYWNSSLASWTPLTAATLGVDYTLQYQNAGDLNGYTLLSVLAPGPPGDFNFDGRVDGDDLLAWQRGNSPMPNSSEDLAVWRAKFGFGATTPATTVIPEPGSVGLVGLAFARLLVGCRLTRSKCRRG